MHYYQTGALNAALTPQLVGARVQPPVLFVAGTHDMVVKMSGGQAKIEAGLREVCAGMPRVVFVPKCGHWVQRAIPPVGPRIMITLDASGWYWGVFRVGAS